MPKNLKVTENTKQVVAVRRGGGWSWQLMSAKDKVLATGKQTFSTSSNALKAFRTLRQELVRDFNAANPR